MKNASTVFDKLSGYLFLTGFITSKLRIIPVALVGAVFNLVSLFAYLIGYVAWYVAALFYPDYPRKQESWYGFAEFRAQYQIAALLGTTATIMCLVFPLLIIPTAWLYTVSNLIWAISEHHKKENPHPQDDLFSSKKQALYLRYAALVTVSSAITAVAATVAFFFPPIAFGLLTGAGIVGIIFTIASLYYWARCTFGHFPPDHLPHSYERVSDNLPRREHDPAVGPTAENEIAPLAQTSTGTATAANDVADDFHPEPTTGLPFRV